MLLQQVSGPTNELWLCCSKNGGRRCICAFVKICLIDGILELAVGHSEHEGGSTVWVRHTRVTGDAAEKGKCLRAHAAAGAAIVEMPSSTLKKSLIGSIWVRPSTVNTVSRHHSMSSLPRFPINIFLSHHT